VRRNLRIKDPISKKFLYGLLAFMAQSAKDEASKWLFTHFASKVNEENITLNDDEFPLLKKIVDATLESASKQLALLPADSPEGIRLAFTVEHYNKIVKEMEMYGKGHTINSEKHGEKKGQ
jgi:hypothetical protein